MRKTMVGALMAVACLALVGACSADPKFVEAGVMTGLFSGTPQPVEGVARQLCKANVPLLELNATTIEVSEAAGSSGKGTATVRIKRPKGECRGRIAFNYTSVAEWKRTGRGRGVTTGHFVAHDFRVTR